MKSCFRLSPLKGHEENGPLDDGGDGADVASDKLPSLCLRLEEFGGIAVVVGVEGVEGRVRSVLQGLLRRGTYGRLAPHQSSVHNSHLPLYCTRHNFTQPGGI